MIHKIKIVVRNVATVCIISHRYFYKLYETFLGKLQDAFHII